MMDPRAAQIARKLTDVALAERREQLRRAIERALNGLAVSGHGRSGAAVLAVQDLCVAEISAATELAWRHLKRALSDLGAQPSEQLAQDLKLELVSHLTEHFLHLESVLRGHHERILGRSTSPGIDPVSVETLGHLQRAFELARTRVGAEIDLAMLSAISQVAGPAETSQTVVHFHQAVGAVQTGAGAVAHVAQHFGPQERGELRAAIESLQAAIAELKESTARPNTEVVDLLEEGRAELEKPVPNMLRIKSVLSGAATTIQTVAGLQPAYQALKTALRPLGVELP